MELLQRRQLGWALTFWRKTNTRADMPNTRTALTATVFFVAGSIASGGCGFGNMILHADSAIGGPLLALSIIAATVAPGVVRLNLVRHRRLAVAAFVGGVLGSLVALFAGWRETSDWYFMRRCRSGVVRACVEAFTQGSRRPEREDFYAPRRACALGALVGCAIEFEYDSARNQETCRSIRRICIGNTQSPVETRRACDIAQKYCP